MAIVKSLCTVAGLLAMTMAFPTKQERQSSPIHSGRMTYYDASAGVGACGTTSASGDNVVAISSSIFSQDKCGVTITVDYNNQAVTGTVVDSCTSCGADDIDVSEAMFAVVADPAQEEVDVAWYSNGSF